MSADFTVNLNGNLNVQGDVTGDSLTIDGQPVGLIIGPLTQEQYDNISTKVPTALYCIKE